MIETGEQIDIWVVDHPLGSGGMGSVYRCHNRNAPRILAAVKVLEAGIRKSGEVEQRFIREAEILFQLDHPNIVKVRNVRIDHDPPYLEMEFVEGKSLEDVLQEGPPPYDQALDLMAQAAAAVHYLHRRGVCHRDIKPPNLLVRNDGRLKLVDFGLALEADGSRITQHGMAFGTVSYAPPEWAGPDLDPITWDVYALGVVFWEILTGKVAFPVSGQGSARQQAMQVIIGKQGHAPLDPGPAFPQGLRDLIADMTRSDASERIRQTAEIRARLHDLDGLGDPLPTDTLDDDPIHDSVVVTAPTPGVPPHRRTSQNTWVTDLGAPEREETTPTAPTRRRSLLAATLVSAGALAFGLTSVLLVLLAWLFVKPGGTLAEVEVVITGIPAQVPVDLNLGGEAADTVEGHRLGFREVATGEIDALWAVGEGCKVAACAKNACPAWCGTGTQSVTVQAVEGSQVLTVPVGAPTPRTVRLALVGPDADTPVEAALSGTPGKRVAEGVAFKNMLPGLYELRVTAGECPTGTAGCAPEGCPEGCADHRGEFVVGWSSDPVSRLELTLGGAASEVPSPTPEPAPAPTPAPAAPTPVPAPAPAPAPVAGARGALVTVGQFADWLASNPDYHPGGPRAQGDGYLPGWSGATPPQGTSRGKAVFGVSWWAANAYCRSRGGLLPVEAPLDAGSPAVFEWRSAGGKPAMVDNMAGPLPTSGSTGLAHTGTRCAR